MRSSLSESSGSRQGNRVLQVLKLRGSGFNSGKHAYRVSSDGVGSSRASRTMTREPPRHHSERITSGVPLLDEMLSEGYWRGASTLVAGPSGSGKTLLALHFVFSGRGSGSQ